MAQENRRLTAGQESPAPQFRGWSENIGTLRSYYQRLQQVAGEAAAVIAPPGTPGGPLDLGINGAVFERETFRIMVLGEFSSGKSTLINALLGKRLLPTKANPATAFTTVLRWGETERAWLYRDGDRRSGETAVTTEEFKREVALQIDAKGAPRTPSFALAVVEQPLELLRRSVEIVDSAGINESSDRELVTLRYLEEVDAVLFVTDAGRPFTLHETENYLSRVRKLGHRDIFFVVNQFDRIEEEERAEVMSRCRNSVAEFSGESGGATPNVFFISALQALRARTDGNEEALKASGIGQLESALEVFCMRDAARVKFVRLAEFLRHNAVNLRVRLHDEGAVLMKSTAELRELLDRSQSTQDQLRASADAIRDIVSTKILGIENELQLRFAAFLTEISREIGEWHVTTGPGRLTRAVRSFTKGGRVAAQHELMDAYTVQLQERMQVFCAQELDQVIEERQGDLVRQLEPLIRAHADLLDKLRAELTGSQSERDQNYLIYTLAIAAGKGKAGRDGRRHSDDVPLMFRPSSLMALGAGGGAVVAGGATAAAAAGLISLGLAVPPVGVAVAIGAAIGPLLASGAVFFADGKLQTRAAEEFAVHVKDSAAQTARQYAGSRAADLREMWGGISGTLHVQLQDLIGIVQRNIEESRQDEQAKAGMRDQLYAFEQRITDVEQHIASFLQPFVSEAEREQ
ncbi:dynamin family protein [Streptomyces sp. NRRL S-244]|uniref:dynamin family protein n=1 Tax=Streptomyces sp. NRRL S-244 TaxID=1463897 RepID=UPI0004BF6755|nr:dynamin family protein [Streptomyces sp. NRRL S-244]